MKRLYKYSENYWTLRAYDVILFASAWIPANVVTISVLLPNPVFGGHVHVVFLQRLNDNAACLIALLFPNVTTNKCQNPCFVFR